MSAFKDEQEQLAVVLKQSFKKRKSIENKIKTYENRTIVGPFIDLCAATMHKQLKPNATNAIAHAADDFSSLFYLTQLMKKLRYQRKVSDKIMRSYMGRAYIHEFLFDLRSIFDYMLLITLIAFKDTFAGEQPGFAKMCRSKLKDSDHIPNFNSFRTDALKSGAEAESIFGNTLFRLWKNCEWFNDINDWRNGISHGGYLPSVNSEKPDLFKLEKLHSEIRLLGISQLLDAGLPPGIFDKEHSDAASFKAFSGFYLGQLIYLLDAWSAELNQKLSVTSPTKEYYRGRGATASEANIKTALALL